MRYDLPEPARCRTDSLAHDRRVCPVKNKERPKMKLRRLFLRRSVPYGLFVLACGLSVAASLYLSSSAAATAEAQARSEFLTDAQQTRRQIQVGLNMYFE